MSLNSAEFARAYQCRSEMRLPIRICEMLDYQQLVIKQQFSPKKRSISSLCQSTKKKKRQFVDDQFVSAFSHMTLEEKTRMYVKHVEYLKLLFERMEPRIVIENDSFTKVLIESGFFGSTWVQVNLKLNAELCTIEIRGKMEVVINLHEYQIRLSSNWRKHAFVLEAIKPGFTEAFRFGFNDQVSCDNCYQAISCLIDKCVFEGFKKQLCGGKQFRLDFQEGKQNNNNNNMITSKQRDNRDEERNNLLTTHIQQELKDFCLTCGQLTVDQFGQQFEILNSSGNATFQYQIFPNEYSEEALYDDANYLSTNEYPEMLHQLKSDTSIFRLNKMYECSIEQIINALSDTERFEIWNQQVKTATMISYIKEANSIVVSEVHKQLVKYYEPRVFTYLRTLFRRGDAVYIVDKPLAYKKAGDDNTEKQFEHFVKGTVVFTVYKLVAKSNGRTLVDVVTKLDHKMIKNRDIEIRLTGMYMEGLLHLDQYLQYNPQRAVNLFDLRYRSEDYKKSNKRMFKREEVPVTVRMVESSILTRHQTDTQLRSPTTTVRIEDDSFYSVAGKSDWNSKAASVFSRKSTTKDSKKEESQRANKTTQFLEGITPIQQLPSLINVSNESKQEKSVVKQKENFINNVKNSPFQQQMNSVNQSSPLIVYKSRNDNKPERVGTEQKQTPKAIAKHNSNSSTQSIITDDYYLSHIGGEKVLPQQNTDGLVIIPQYYLNPTKPYPMAPNKSYPWKNQTDKDWSHYFLKNVWQITPLGQFKCVNQKLIDAQSEVLKLVLKRVAANLMSGKGFNLSLPVEVFGTISNLEMVARCYSFAPRFLQKAVTIKDPLQRFKLAMCFHLGKVIAYLQMTKPFDPILGQTFQCWINGCPYYAEQISHHPPSSSNIFFGRGYHVSETVTADVQISVNSATAYNNGFCQIQFDDNPEHKIYLVNPGGEIHGLAYGDRKLIFTNKGFCFDTLGHYCEIQYNPYKKSMFSFGKQTKEVDILESKIYKMDKIHTIEFRRKFTKDGINRNLLKNPVCTVSGRITQELRFDNVVYFDVRKDEPCSYEHEAYPLASNSNYREDILYKIYENEDMAQQHKHRLENIQRRDKRLRLKQEK